MAEIIKKAKGGKKNRKWDRNRRWCQAYKARRQREHNKLTRIARHLTLFPKDDIAKRAFAHWQSELRVRVAA